MPEKKYKYSEIFHSFQGEGTKTGTSCAWIRYFLCNLQCDGFGQKDPTDPSTYILPYKTFDVSQIKRAEDLPVWEYGCDSSYTWSARYKHLMHSSTAAEICDKLEEVLKHGSNPEGKFLHPRTGQWHHMCFTGGEPMLKHSQPATAAILTQFLDRDNLPNFVTVETNGTTQLLNSDLRHIIGDWYDEPGREWFWSVSPKLWSTAGEEPEKAIHPYVLAEYAKLSNHGHLKYVVNGTAESWAEVEANTKLFRQAGVDWPVWIMIAGATKESQENDHVASVAIEALKRGYNFSGRLHCSVFGNKVGT